MHFRSSLYVCMEAHAHAFVVLSFILQFEWVKKFKACDLGLAEGQMDWISVKLSTDSLSRYS